jgi:hypothetical protein
MSRGFAARTVGVAAERGEGAAGLNAKGRVGVGDERQQHLVTLGFPYVVPCVRDGYLMTKT